jgi:hypothetical protein
MVRYTGRQMQDGQIHARQIQGQRIQDGQMQRQIERRIKAIVTSIVTGAGNADGRHGRSGDQGHDHGDRREENLGKIPR